jgi:hypothetical protein
MSEIEMSSALRAPVVGLPNEYGWCAITSKETGAANTSFRKATGMMR